MKKDNNIRYFYILVLLIFPTLLHIRMKEVLSNEQTLFKEMKKTNFKQIDDDLKQTDSF